MTTSADLRTTHRVSVLSIGVGSFDEGSDVEELGFVSSRMAEVVRAFEQLEASVECSRDQSEGEIEALLRRWLIEERDAADVVVIHLIGHGRADRSGRLSFVARDDRDVDLDRWIEKAQQEVERDGNRRHVVFLVDTCSAGAATGRQPISELGGERGVWSLGASVSSAPTEQGRFSRWIATALDRLRGGDFALQRESITFTAFIQELIRVGKRDSAGRRISLGFSVEQGDGDWSFLPNPKTAGLTAEQIRMQRRSLGYVPGEEDLRRDVGARVAAGEEIDDAVYFLDRASGRGLVPTSGRQGFFSGRTAELGRYVAWQSGDCPLLTVTGAAGAGKSGLLGLIVCSAHPELRGRFHELWEPVTDALPEVQDIVAVHARQRSPQQLIETIANLAALEPPVSDDAQKSSADDPHTWTVPSLRAALEREGKNRLIVLDAVDESIDPQAVLQLVAALLTPANGQGGSCRVVLGGRPEVVNALSASDEMSGVRREQIDLDRADPLDIERDLRHYIERLLLASESYAVGPASAFVEPLAKLGAERMVRNLQPSGPWGPFLLAGLYVHYLVTLDHPPQDLANANAHARCASTDLPDLLEAILTARDHRYPALRAVLAILARSKGPGMPRVTLRRCLNALDARDITEQQFDETLREASPFLRTGIDSEGKTLYRIFQQGLADYMRDHPLTADPADEAQQTDLDQKILSEILSPFIDENTDEAADRWYSAEPYVLHHALGHVMTTRSAKHAEILLSDPYFLIRFDPSEDHRAIDLCQAPRSAEYIRLLSASWLAHGRLSNAADRASVFAYDADRLGLEEHRKLFLRVAREVTFQPEETGHSFLWATGGLVDSSVRFIDSGSVSVTGNVSFSPDGQLLAVSTLLGVQVLETETWRHVTPSFGRTVGHWITRVAFSPDGRMLAFAGNSGARNVQFWDVHNRVLHGKPWECRTGTVRTLAFSPDGRLLAVASEELDVSVWDITTDNPVETARLKDTERSYDVGFSISGDALVVCGDNGVSLWDTESWKVTSLSEAKTRAAAFSPDGRTLALLHGDGVALCGLDTGEVGHVDMAKDLGVGLAFSSDSALLAVSRWNSLHVIDTASQSVLSDLIEDGPHMNGAAFHPLNTTLLVSGDSDGRLRIWNGLVDKTETVQLPRFESEFATASPDGRLIAAFEGGTGHLTLHCARTGEVHARMPVLVGAEERTCFFSPDSKTLVAVGRRNDALRVVHIDSLASDGTSVHLGGTPSSVGHLGAARMLFSFAPDSRLFALVLEESSSRGTYAIKVWDPQSLRLVARIPLPGKADSLRFSGSDKVFVGINGALSVYAVNDPDLEGGQA
ncbi:hypothetical protein ACGF8D_12270 [Streptomyces massasporeus]|uniref:nSTAND1 domain-containing NTPase n=1 Tax=Streptomyces massasporeus TaxID=67324 RepID=UPI003723F04D